LRSAFSTCDLADVGEDSEENRRRFENGVGLVLCCSEGLAARHQPTEAEPASLPLYAHFTLAVISARGKVPPTSRLGAKGHCNRGRLFASIP
jgi:hypothetical protein